MKFSTLRIILAAGIVMGAFPACNTEGGQVHLKGKLQNSKHPIKYTIPNITKAAIPIVGYAAFAIYSHSFFHLCGSICSSSSFVAFCIYGILAITSFR